MMRRTNRVMMRVPRERLSALEAMEQRAAAKARPKKPRLRRRYWLTFGGRRVGVEAGRRLQILLDRLSAELAALQSPGRGGHEKRGGKRRAA